MTQDDLTAKQLDYAVYLPAISGFYSTFIGRQRIDNTYVDPARFPAGMTDMEQMNWLNSAKALFPYKWSLYSAGHANLDLNKPDASEDMVRNREKGSLILGDSGGFQIAKGLWEGEWRDPTSKAVKQKIKDLTGKTEVRKGKGKNAKPVTVDLLKEYCAKIAAAQKKREDVLAWLDSISDYCMTLDIPTWVVHDKFASSKCGITTHEEAVDATKYNNEYFMKHRKGVKAGGTKILNVLQGAQHTEAEDWYQTMKKYCDPKQYPDTHFDGWAMGGQNMCDVHLILHRLVTMRHDNLLQQGKHDWMHFLGTSRLEWSVLLTVIQRNVRKYVNPNFTISYDCASPFLATANGQVYYENVFPQDGKWSYRMAPSADDRKYATDTRNWKDGVLADGIYPRWNDSPLSELFKMKDICIYGIGDKNKVGKEGKTSWDSFSYALLMGHNVWMHLTAVQEANRRFDSGEHPAMMRYTGKDREFFENIVEAIFATDSKEEAMAIIEHYKRYWMEIIGGRGKTGKKALNADTMAKKHVIIEGSGPAMDKVKKVKGTPVLHSHLFEEN